MKGEVNITVKKLSNDDNISGEQMTEAILRSGYLLERRVATLLGKVGYKAVANRGFIDSETGKSREYDVYAYKSIPVYKTGSHEIYPTLICECKNNPRPIAFFIKGEPFEPFVDEVKVSGIPAKMWRNDRYISFQEFVDLSFYYPVIIFQGDLFAAHIENNNPVLKKCEHIQYNPEFFSFYDNEVINYHVDVISEEYLPSYLKIIDREMLTIKNLLQKQKKGVLLSINKIIEECRSLKKKPKAYRKYLEFDSYR
jgi:hypothetical protein